MTVRNGGTALVAALKRHEVDTIFGIPGTHNLEIYRGLAGSGIRHISMRHEQGAGYAADGYARTTGRPGICLTTSGPGLTNIVTAVATAHADSVPLLVIAPGPARGAAGGDRGGLHEMRDQQAMMAGVVESAVRVDSTAEATAAVADAFAAWTRGRPRPRYVEVPVDVLEEAWDGEFHDRPTPTGTAPRDAAAISRAVEALARAERPVVVVGGGARGAAAEVRALVERLSAPLISTVNGKGVLPETHRLSLGASVSLPGAQRVMADADVLLLVGTEWGDSDLWGNEVAVAGHVLRVDVDDRQIDKNLPASIGLVGDAAVVLADLVDQLNAADGTPNTFGDLDAVRDQIRREVDALGDDWAAINSALHGAFTGDVTVAGDSAKVSYYGTVHSWPMGPADRFLYPTGYATLGYGLPAAIGANLGGKHATTLALVGDGGFMFTAQELVSAAELGLGLPVVIVNNGGYGEIRDQMTERDIPTLGVDLRAPDFPALGRACGGYGVRADDPDQAAREVAVALTRNVPTVIELPVRVGR